MKKGFYPLFFIGLVGLAGCGQKGKLFLPETKQANTNTQVIKVSNKQSQIEPNIQEVKALSITGKQVNIADNSAVSWKAILADNINTDSVQINYILFKSDLLDFSKSGYQMQIGKVTDKVTDNSGKITSGIYLRFRSIEKGHDKMPNLISSIREYFEQNNRYQRVGNSDFMTEKDGNIDIYIRVLRAGHNR